MLAKTIIKTKARNLKVLSIDPEFKNYVSDADWVQIEPLIDGRWFEDRWFQFKQHIEGMVGEGTMS